MANAFDYLMWRGDIPLAYSPVNEIDGMLLSRLSYAPFELAGQKRAITIGDACKALLKIENIEEKLLMKSDKRLLELLSESERFRHLVLFEYVNRVDEESETQFAAVTVQLTRGRFYVAFRGTDDNLVGWKEDFNMSFTTPVPAQKMAVEYFERIAWRVRGRFILGGHSKGGNLAVYASAFSKTSASKRIDKAQNFDGPGFDEKVLTAPGYIAARERIDTYVPQSSVIGLLLNHEEEYTIVKSTQNGLWQHDTYSWEVERDRFVYLEKVTDASRFIDHTLKEWISQMSPEKREKLVDVLYSVLLQTNAKTVRELSENWVGNTISVLKTLRTLDDETRKVLIEAIRALAKGAGKVVAENFKSR
ncbi:MAG: DUF2974 domain-containing protein [Oscillospiraceae bacterium]|nr:DUF2974 domain-containing protein [Oscillospiraceae bacterium]